MKIVKKISVFVLVLLYIFAFSFSLRKASADTIITSNKISIKGAEIRKTGEKQGLRFVGKIDDSFETEYDDVVGYGILVAYGNVAGANIYHGQNPNGKRLGEYYAEKANLDRDDSDNPCIKYTIYNIPDSEISTTLSARMYAKLSDGTYIYSEGGKQRNVEDVARRAYSEGETSTLIDAIAAKGKIRVIHSNGEKNYYNSLEGLVLQEDDKLSFLAGTYNDAIDVSVNGIEINGVYAGILCDSTSRKDEAESVFTQTITVKNGVDGFTVNGIKSTAEKAIVLEDSQNNVEIKYSKINSTLYGVSDVNVSIDKYANVNHENVTILKNKFIGQSATENRLIYFQGYAKRMTVDTNSFSSVVSSGIRPNEYAIKLNRVKKDSVLTIKNNQFNQKYANYQIDLGYSHTSTNYLRATINIENNTGIGCADGNEFCGNGFRICCVGSTSTINLIHNTDFRFSKYYNTILFSEATGTGSADINPGTQDPIINIKYNAFYGDENSKVVNANRNSLSDNYINFGLGFKSDASKIAIDHNYICGTARGYSFKTNSSADSDANVYGTGVVTNTSPCESIEALETAYEAYLAG